MRIVVFGAGGFIGGWICEELSQRSDIEHVACVRQWASAVRLARRGLSIVQVDIERENNLAALVSGADVVVNATMPVSAREPSCAARLYLCCRQAGVGRFIQFSSIAVYGNRTGEVDEDAVLAPTDPYGSGKADMEKQVLLAAAESGPQLVILRPTIVYGPFSENWTVRYARRIVEGRWYSLGPSGAGICNLVHGHDVAKAVVLAATADIPGGSHVLNINSPEVVSWNEYIALFGDELGVADRVTPNSLIFNLSAIAVQAVRKGGSWAKAHGIRRREGSSARIIERAQSLVGLYPTIGELKLLRRRVRYTAERAVSVLGFRSSVPLNEGLRQSAEWCRVHGVV